MSETITREAVDDVAVEDLLIEPDVFEMEATDGRGVVEKPWGDELVALVCANQEVIVKCPWMGDAEVTLGIAMTTFDYPPNLTAADEPFLISIVNELLASQVVAIEETEKEEARSKEALGVPADKKRPQEDKEVPTKKPVQETKTEVDTPHTKPKTADTLQPSEKIIDASQDLKASAIRGGEHLEHIDEDSEVTKETVVFANDKLSQSPQDPTVKKSQHIINPDSPLVTETLSVASSSLDTPAEEPVIDEVKSEPEVPKMIKAEATTQSNIEEHPALIEPQSITIRKPGPPTQETIKMKPESVEQTNNVVGVSQDQPELSIIDYGGESSVPINFHDQEVLTHHCGATDIQVPETVEHDTAIAEAVIPRARSEPRFISQQVVDLEEQTQADVITERIEDSLVQLAEYVKASDTEVAEVTNESLGKIIETIAKLEIPSSDNIDTETKTQEDLEELFTEIFNTMKVDYTPELIKYLASQIIELRDIEENKELKGEEEEKVPPVSSIHIIIKKLIVILKRIKSTMAQTCAIGRAALALCSFNFQLKPNESF